MKVPQMRFIGYVRFAMRLFYNAIKYRKHYMGFFVAPKNLKNADWDDFTNRHKAFLRSQFQKMVGKG